MMIVTNKVKNYAIAGLLLAIAASMVFHYLQSKQIKSYAEKNGKLQSQLATAISSQKNLTQTIDALQAEKLSGQVKTDQLARELMESTRRESQTLTKLREALKNESCASKPIPGDVDWLYVDGSGDGV